MTVKLPSCPVVARSLLGLYTSLLNSYPIMVHAFCTLLLVFIQPISSALQGLQWFVSKMAANAASFSLGLYSANPLQPLLSVGPPESFSKTSVVRALLTPQALPIPSPSLSKVRKQTLTYSPVSSVYLSPIPSFPFPFLFPFPFPFSIYSYPETTAASPPHAML